MTQKHLVKDIVCGMIKPKKEMPFTADYQYQTYYFCTQQDKQIFEAYPNRWVRTKNLKGEK